MFAPTPKDDPLQTRRVALQILLTVFEKKQPLDQVLDNSNGFLALEARDKAFTRMLVTTTIRRLGQIDDIIKQGLSKPDQEITPLKLRMILRLGATQLVFMAVPDHAGVNMSVQLTEEMGLARVKGFVNAVLRKVAQNGKTRTTQQDIPRLNTPEWVLKRFIADYGLGTAIKIGEANMAEAPLDLTLKSAQEKSYWESNLQARVLPTGSLRLSKQGRVDDIPGYADGAWWVQDASASLPAQLFQGVLGKHIIDLCAAPGGKTAQLAAAGAKVTALDRSPRRLMRFKENMERLGLGRLVTTEAADATVWQPKERADGVLLDAPCSASGTLKKRPDVAWLKGDDDLESLKETQKRLLDNATSMIKPGGFLIYCTCSLFKEESEDQVTHFLSRHGSFERVAITKEEIGGLSEYIDENGDVRILPFHLAAFGGMDGFYIARLRKK